MQRPTPPWARQHAVNPDLPYDQVLRKLRSGVEVEDGRYHRIRQKIVVSAVVMIAAMDARDVADVLLMAETETKKTLTPEQVTYAVMLLIFGGKSRQARQMASEYGRAAQTLLRDDDKSAAHAFGRLQEEGIKRLARATASTKGPVSLEQKRWSFAVPAHLVGRLDRMPAQDRLDIVLTLEVDAKGRRKLVLVDLPQASVGPKQSAVSAKPTPPPTDGRKKPPPPNRRLER